MEALLAAARDPLYPAEIVLVLSNNPDAAGLATAAAAGVATKCVDHRPFKGDRGEKKGGGSKPEHRVEGPRQSRIGDPDPLIIGSECRLLES